MTTQIPLLCRAVAKGRRASTRALGTLVLALAAGPLCAQTASDLPPEVRAALQRARVPESALSVVIQEAGTGTRLLQHQANQPVNPASLAKLVTTYAALDLLGPAWTWATPVLFTGPVRDGVLEGDLVLKGAGDPKLVVERLWQLLRRVQTLGVREIRGDIVLDRSAFVPPEATAGDFDGDASRPYNVQPDALLLNFHATTYTFTPEPARQVARVSADTDPPSAPERTVPLTAGACDDWRTALKAQVVEGAYRFTGGYAAACGEQAWPLADPNPLAAAARLVAGQWRELGGRLGGRVREGRAPAGARLAFEWRSPALAEVVRDINKFSNNVMAQQLFLTLALQRPGTQGGNTAVGAPASTLPAAAGPAQAEAAREVLRRWVTERIGEPPAGELVIDNGSGLSRQWRVSAQWLAHLLQHAWSGPVMPELMASLPVTGLDGTLRRARAPAGRAHLKTGSLRDVVGLAGWVLGQGGRRHVFVAIVHHPNAQAARPALDALVQWTMRDGPAR